MASRFSLVGGLFETIERSTGSITEWATLFVQLIVRGVVDLTNNSDLFTLVLDMLAILVHSALISDSVQQGSQGASFSDEIRKNHAYVALVKKLKKEVSFNFDKKCPSRENHVFHDKYLLCILFFQLNLTSKHLFNHG